MSGNQRSRYARVCAHTIVLFGSASLLILAAVMLLPAPAQAVLPFDPASVVQGEYTQWTATAQGFARTIYSALVIFELIAVAITALLFRENVGEFFATVGFKAFMGCLFFWLIANGPNLAQGVISWFASIGQNQFGGPGGSADPYVLFAGVIAVATAFFTAADVGHDTDQTTLVGLSTPPLCTWAGGWGACPVATVAATVNSHPVFSLIAQGIALVILMAAAAIILQFSIITIESLLVMSVGVMFIGFAGSRWTFSFSQGYFSYMINVGVKLMVTYIMLGVATNELLPILLTTGVSINAAAALPFGFGADVAIGAAAIAAVYIVLTAGLLWTIPAFTAALLTGQSQSSGFAILQQAAGSFAGAATTFANLSAAKHSARNSADSAKSGRSNSQGRGMDHASATSTQVSMPTPRPPGADQRSADDSVGNSSGQQYTDSSGRPQSPSPESYRAYALGGLAQAAPREIGQPSAVQIRMSTQDKL